jgi:hypothetical protein
LNPSEFVRALTETCRDSAVSDVVSNLKKPPGRKAHGDLNELSVWFNSLPAEEQARTTAAMRMAADYTLFGVLCVLDGVRTIEHSTEKSRFRLTASKGKVDSVLLPGMESLHDIYRRQS